MDRGPPLTLAGRVLLITGSTGIAEATAKLAGERGARVFVASRTEKNCRALSDAINHAGGECGFGAADLTRPDEAATVVRACFETYGRIDGVFNVAGISARKYGDGPVHELTDEGWSIAIAVNLTSMFHVCREAVRLMLEQPSDPQGIKGAILNMSSVLADHPEPEFFSTHAYAASKGGINALTTAMAAHYAPRKIRVNAIAPALVRTPMSRRAQEDAAILERMLTKQPLVEDLIDAEAVARAALFLLGPDASAITGQRLAVDAGWSVSG